MRGAIIALLIMAATSHGQGVIPKTASVVDGGHRYDVDTNGKRLVVPEVTYTNAVLMLPFSDDDGGDYYDVSKAGNDGAQTTAGFRPAWTNGWGGAYEFDGVDDYIEVPSSASLNLTAAITVSAWINLTDDAAVDVIIDKRVGVGNRSWTLETTTAGVITFSVRQSDDLAWVTVNSTSTTGSGWQHVAGTFDGSAVVIYVNGAQEDINTSYGGAMLGGASRLSIGTIANSPHGIMDDHRVYSRALTTSEILAEYNAEQTIANGGKR